MRLTRVSVQRAPAQGALDLRFSLTACALALTWLALVAGMLGRRWWVFDLFAHFRVHYLALFMALAGFMLILHRVRWAFAAVLGAAVSAAPLIAYIPRSAAPAAADGAIFRLITLNVWFRNADDARLAAYLARTHADAIVLQEIAPRRARALSQLLPRYRYVHTNPDGRGAAVLSRWPLRAAELKRLAEDASRGAYVQVDWRGARFALLGAHLHWPLTPSETQRRDGQLLGIASLARAQSGPFLVAGDFNLTPWSPKFPDLLERSGLQDCAQGRGFAASWPSRAAWLGIRIDHCLASPQWRVLDVHVGPHVGSDHRPIVVDLSLRAAE